MVQGLFFKKIRNKHGSATRKVIRKVHICKAKYTVVDIDEW